jgi:heat shock protein HslJ
MRKTLSMLGAAALLLTVLGSVALLSGSPADAQSSANLEGVQWSLVSYVDKAGNEAKLLPDTRITAEFKEGRVSGTGGCNAYSAPYEAKDGKISVGSGISTMMMCSPQAVMDQESAYLKALRAAAGYKIDGDRLTLSDAKGAALLTFRAEEPGTLSGGAWMMTMYNNGKGGFQSGMPNVQVTAIFDEHGKLSGHGGCNSYFAQYSVEGNKIEIGPIGSTRMACPQPVMDQETAYFRALESAATFKIEGSRLMLRTAEDASAV